MSSVEKSTDYKDSGNNFTFAAIAAFVAAVAVIARFAYLTLRPLHHDEGVNGWFLTNLFREGVYKYDPANYHGPTLYYIALVFVHALGLTTAAIRSSVAIWGVLIVVAAFWLRPYLGRKATLLTAFLLAVSPGLVFIARYFIHETFFVFLSFAGLVAILQFARRQAAGVMATVAFSGIVFISLITPLVKAAEAFLPSGTAALAGQVISALAAAGLTYGITRFFLDLDGGRPIYLILAAACLALMFATKETAFITIGVMLAAGVCVEFRDRLAERAAAGRSVTGFIAGATAAGALFDIVIRLKLPETAADFARQTADITGYQNALAFEVLFYAFGLLIPPLLAAGLYRLDKRTPGQASESGLFSEIRRKFPRGRTGAFAIAFAAAIAAYLIVFFFSSLFTYWEGIKGFFEAYAIWTKTGSKDHTQNGFWAYAEWGMQSDGAIFVAALAGSAIAIVRRTNRLATYVAFWWIGLFAAYTLIPYKTPWLALSFLLPACISAGYGLAELTESDRRPIRYLGLAFTLIVLASTIYKAWELNFIRYDDEDAPMVYAHTQREFNEMVARIEQFANATGKGRESSIDIVSPDYWPLVWYLRDYPKATFHGRLYEASDADMIVAKKDEQDDAVIRRFSANYRFYGPYKLRPGVKLVLLVKKDIPGNSGRELYELKFIRE